jgi:hypothetical protein
MNEGFLCVPLRTVPCDDIEMLSGCIVGDVLVFAMALMGGVCDAWGLLLLRSKLLLRLGDFPWCTGVVSVTAAPTSCMDWWREMERAGGRALL